MRIIRKTVNINSIWTGIVLLCIMLAAILGYMCWINKSYENTTVTTEELNRGATADALDTPYEAAMYALEAIADSDLDMFLRGCPIDEVCLNFDAEQFIEIQNTFSVDSMMAPSAVYSTYFPISSAELTGNMTDAFEEFVKAYTDLGCPEVKEIAYIMPEEQMSNEYQAKSSELFEASGAENGCEVMALLEKNGVQYICGFTLVNYDNYWKVLQLKASLLDVSEDSMIMMCDDALIAELLEKDKQTEFSKYLENQCDIESKSIDFNDKNTELITQLSEETVLLPPNYFITGENYGKSPEEVLEKFVLAVEKKDLTLALSYGAGALSEEKTLHTDPNKLKKQSDFAEQIKCLMYSILWDEVPVEEKTLSTLGMTGRQIINKLNPEDSFYIDMNRIVETEDDTVFVVYFSYLQQDYKSEVQLSESENGWQIVGFSAMEKLE